jgi:hypothetical protein
MIEADTRSTVEFPFDLPLGTTVTFAQSIHYRQRLARVNPIMVHWRWVGPGGMNYAPAYGDHAASPTVEEVSTRTFAFSDRFPILLDRDHSLAFNAFGAQRYLWDVFTFTADANGRMYAIVQVLLSAPASEAQTTDFFGLHNLTGDLEKTATAYIEPVMPVDVGPIWGLLDLEAARIIASSVGGELSVVSEVKAEAPPFADQPYVRLAGFEQPNVPGIWVKQVDVYEGGSVGGVVAESPWTVLPAVPHHADDGLLNIRAEVHASVGVQSLTASGLRRDDLAAAAPVPTAVEVAERATERRYALLNVDELEGFRLFTSEGSVPAASQLFDVRPWGGGGLPKLAFLALDSDAAGGATHVVTWDHEAGRAAVAADLARGAHGLSGATSSAALVNSYLGPDFEPAGFVVRLDESRPPVAFLGESMWSFTVLDPAYLYNAEDAKFYRLSPPLRRTALPAALAGTADTSGDFHAIRLPER